jgi:hypothetical protein
MRITAFTPHGDKGAALFYYKAVLTHLVTNPLVTTLCRGISIPSVVSRRHGVPLNTVLQRSKPKMARSHGDPSR